MAKSFTRYAAIDAFMRVHHNSLAIFEFKHAVRTKLYALRLLLTLASVALFWKNCGIPSGGV